MVDYHRLLAAGIQIQPPAQLPTDADITKVIEKVTGNDVHGLINPYLGLHAFTYADRAIYAGREQLAQETVQQLTLPGAQQTIMFITGTSGSGKSSFAQAALIPLLETHYAAYQKLVRHASFRPSSQPMAMLHDALQKLHPNLTSETIATNTPKAQINFLLIDQFEELFIQSDPSHRQPFCDFLTNLPEFATCRTHILITLRVDYLDELFAIQPLWAIAKAGVELRTMQPDALLNAIQKPLQVTHPTKRFAPELLERLVQDAGADAALLPLLQVTLAELWKTGKLVLSNYHSLTDAIRQRAETVYAFRDHASADPKTPRPADEQQELMSILLNLINVSADEGDHRDSRQRRTRQELVQGQPQRLRLIEELVNARLLTAASETHNDEVVEVIDIIHESLIANWARLRTAIQAQRQRLQQRARFKLWLNDWLRHDQQASYLLLTDIQLAEARTLADHQDIELQNVDGQRFYQRSLEHQAAIQQAQAQAAAESKARQQWLRRLGIALALALVAAGVAFWQWQRTQESADGQAKARATAEIALTVAQQNVDKAATAEAQAQQDKAIAQQAEATAESANQESIRLKDQINADQIAQKAALANIDTSLDHYPQRALLVAVEAVRMISPPIPSILTNLHALLQRSGGLPLTGHGDWGNSVAFSPDGKWLASGSNDKTVRLWLVDRPSTQPVVLQGHEAHVNSVAFSMDSKWLASASGKTVRLWQVDKSSAEPVILRGHEAEVYSIAFSPDGKWLATGSLDNTVKLWQVTQPNVESVVLRRYQLTIFFSVAFSPDGKWLATGSRDTTVRLWTALPNETIALACTTAGRNLTQAEWQQYFPDHLYHRTCPQWPAGE